MRISRTQRRTSSLGRRPRRTRPEVPALEWAEDAAGRCPRVTAVGSRSLLVENHTGILGFSDSEIRLNSRSGPLCVTGSGLALRDVRPGALIVRGSIRQVQLPCGGGDAPDAR